MNQTTYMRFSGIVFLVIAIAHAWRVLFQIPVQAGGWSVPLWLSVVAVCIAGFMAYHGLRLSRRE